MEQEILVQTRRHAGGEFSFAPFDDHLLSMHLGASITLKRTVAGGFHRERVVCGDIILVPAGQASVWQHAEPTHYLNLHLPCAVVDRTAAQVGSEHSGSLTSTNPAAFQDPQVEQIALLLQSETESGAPHGRLYAEMLASALCIHLLQREGSRTKRTAPALLPSKCRAELRQALAYIQDNLTMDLSLEAIAREVGLSSCYFARLFTEAFGVPPHQYVIQARVERAKILITRDGLALGDAARHTGFADQSHFTRHFKRLVGVTPRAFAWEFSHKRV